MELFWSMHTHALMLETVTVFEVPTNSCFGKYYHCIQFIVKATRLAKKIRKWFADDQTRSIGLQRKSPACFITMDDDQQSHTFKLHVFAYPWIHLRDAVSLLSRVTISNEQIQSLCEVCSNFFSATALFLSAKPTSWTIGHIVLAHARQIHQSLGMVAFVLHNYQGKFLNAWFKRKSQMMLKQCITNWSFM